MGPPERGSPSTGKVDNTPRMDSKFAGDPLILYSCARTESAGCVNGSKEVRRMFGPSPRFDVGARDPGRPWP